MKGYHECKKVYIGESDAARLVLVGLEEAKFLDFTLDEKYRAYLIVDMPEIEIPDYYRKVAEFEKYVKIYDDNEATAEFLADKIEFFRAGDMGCIIRLTGAE